MPARCRSRSRCSTGGFPWTATNRSPTIAAGVLDRQREDEPAAAAALTLHPDPPAVQLDEAFRERESEPRALRGGGARPRACLSEMLRGPVPEPAATDDPLRFFRQWLAGRNLGLVPIADAAAFDWPGQWIAVFRDGEDEHAW